VASEVRSLAGRSADAAKEIKSLISASVEKVEVGARQVNDVKVAKDEFEVDYAHTDSGMSWTLVAPSKAQKDASGSWALVSKGAGTQATLTLSIDPSLPLPGFLMKKALGDTLKGATKGLKKRCEH
jgi:hypothetical protein